MYPVEEKSVAQLQADMTSGAVTSEQLVQAYLARIESVDRSGPTLNSVITLNPDAAAQARALDDERKQGHVRGPLHGIPVLIKDNIESQDNMATTAGSLALADNITHRDAPLVARLRAAGAVILGKTNLSEWANIRSTNSTSGWSAVGGLTRNPYALDRNACGSSAGSGAAGAASLAAVVIGTETDGSVTCPASMNGLVGIKPTVGLVSRTHIIPISHSQDTAGPMGRSVQDVAATLTVIAGSDPDDPATAQADAHRTDYLAALNANSLQGARIGVLRFQAGFSRDVDAQFDAALKQLQLAGATLVEIAHEPPGLEHVGDDETLVLQVELRADLNTYLATTPPNIHTRTLADLIAFNTATPAELTLFGQEFFENAEKTHGLRDPAYVAASARARRMAGAQGIDRMLRENHVTALVAPTYGPPWVTDIVAGDHFTGGASTTYPAVAGYPHVTVPMGQVAHLPVGLSFIGPAWSDAQLLSYAFAYESHTHTRRPPTYAR
ncbi:MAG: amidase, partial [Pseudomonadota bacterium]